MTLEDLQSRGAMCHNNRAGLHWAWCGGVRLRHMVEVELIEKLLSEMADEEAAMFHTPCRSPACAAILWCILGLNSRLNRQPTDYVLSVSSRSSACSLARTRSLLLPPPPTITRTAGLCVCLLSPAPRHAGPRPLISTVRVEAGARTRGRFIIPSDSQQTR